MSCSLQGLEFYFPQKNRLLIPSGCWLGSAGNFLPGLWSHSPASGAGAGTATAPASIISIYLQSCDAQIVRTPDLAEPVMEKQKSCPFFPLGLRSQEKPEPQQRHKPTNSPGAMCRLGKPCFRSKFDWRGGGGGCCVWFCFFLVVGVIFSLISKEMRKQACETYSSFKKKHANRIFIRPSWRRCDCYLDKNALSASMRSAR